MCLLSRNAFLVPFLKITFGLADLSQSRLYQRIRHDEEQKLVISTLAETLSLLTLSCLNHIKIHIMQSIV